MVSHPSFHNPHNQPWRNPVVENTTKEKEYPVIMTVHDVSEYLRMSEAKVYRLVKERQIPVVRIGRTWRFRKDLLDQWLSPCTESSMDSDLNGKLSSANLKPIWGHE
jgi:excisionase family DNA binding protein